MTGNGESAVRLFSGARVFTASARRWADAMVVVGERIAYVGDETTARNIAGRAAVGKDLVVTDFDGALVLPGFVDAHAHVISTGETRGHVDLWGTTTLVEVQQRIAAGARDRLGAQRIRAHGWQHAALPGGRPTRQQLDAVVSDRPVYAQAYDFHSMWLNSAALAELGIGPQTPDTAGGRIHRDDAGEATGYIDETAMHRYVWPFLERSVTDDERDEHLASALNGYRAAGVTAVTDIGLDEHDLAAMARAEHGGRLTARIVGHWRIQPTGDAAQNLAQVARARELAARHTSPWLRVTGIKVMVDGTVDGCTAALGHPYVDASLPDPIWSLAELAPVVVAADAAGLQIAMHAIGDEAVRIAIAAVEEAVAANGPRDRRHRIEHLEVVDRVDIDRLAALGITASMQPVHADPAIQANWRAQLGDHRIERGFPWPEMTAAGATLAFGTDSPTSPFAPLPNMFVASTRRSALRPELRPNLPGYAVPLPASIEHATRDAAWACRAEGQFGVLAPGLAADFVVLDRDVFALPVEELLATRIRHTVVAGRTVFTAAPSEAADRHP